jgi:hypothetical protein
MIVSRTRFLVGILLIGLAGGGMGVYGLTVFYTSLELRVAGVEVPGKVIGGRTQAGSRNGQSYYLTVRYEYNPGDGPTQREFEVSRAGFETREQAPDVRVRVLPSNPEVAHLVGEESNGFLFIAVGVWFLIASALMLRYFIKTSGQGAVAQASGAA